MIIGINGKLGSGKDSLGNIIQYYHQYNTEQKWEIKKFAFKLKQMAGLFLGVDPAKFEDQEYKKSILGPEWNEKFTYPFSSGGGEPTTIDQEMTVREFLIRLGTEAIRDGLHKDAWVNALFADYKTTDYLFRFGDSALVEHGAISVEEALNNLQPIYPNWIITDVRFPNEAQAIKDRGGVVVRITREDNPFPKINHESETALDNWEFDAIIENKGSIDDLKVEAVKFLNSIL